MLYSQPSVTDHMKLLKMSSMRGKRITFKRAKPNMLLEKCLERLWLDAKISNSKHEPILRTAMSSLSKYPLPLKSGADCAILKGFNKTLCLLLDQYLETCNINELKSIKSAEEVVCLEDDKDKALTVEDLPSHPVNNVTNNTDCQIEKLTQKEKQSYKPIFRSGSYAILMGLLEHSKKNLSSFIKKSELIEVAQKYCDESFTVPKSVRYSAWSSMNTLLSKGLVKKNGVKNAQYMITDEGFMLANQLWEETKSKTSINDITFKDSINASHIASTESSKATDEYITNDVQISNKSSHNLIKMPANSFTIILIIDKNELNGSSSKSDPFSIYPHLKYETRSLKVGDFTWIAKHITDGTELVLPYIVERKRMDDFAASIKDGRFHEQKFRLRKCGLKNVIYLIESYDKNKHVGLPLPSLQQALANTRIQDGFKIYATESNVKTNQFLAMMSKRLEVEFKNKCIQGTDAEPSSNMLMTFDYFNKSSIKNKTLTVTEMFIKMLLQLKGMSVEKALAITNEYKTPKSLIIAYQNCTQKEGEYLLANLKYGDLNKNVGPSVSISVFHLFNL